MNNKIEFDVGEEKHVRLMIHSTRDDAFEIDDAKWELLKAGTVVASGECTINDHEIDMLIAPEARCRHQLVITYKIADETLIEQIEVQAS
jgi:hypothetical protein